MYDYEFSYDLIIELLTLFNDSIIEIWWLMDSVYRFQYLNHIKALNDDASDDFVLSVKPSFNAVSSNSANSRKKRDTESEST